MYSKSFYSLLHSYTQGRVSPQQPWRSSPQCHVNPPPPFHHPTRAKNYDILYAIFAILRMFLVNFGSLQSGIMTPEIKKI